MTRLFVNLMDSELHKFAQEAHEARFPVYAWKAVACDMMGIPVGSRPTIAQMLGIKCTWMTLWQELTQRFDQMTTVRYAETVENEEERVHNALVHLGSSPEKVAWRLSQMGIVGDLMEQCDCPISHFFRGIYGAWFVQVFRYDSYVDFVKVSNPLAVEQFVNRFDNGSWSQMDMFPDRLATLSYGE